VRKRGVFVATQTSGKPARGGDPTVPCVGLSTNHNGHERTLTGTRTMSEHTRIIEITADNPRTAEQIVHQLRKEAENAARYGEQVTVRRVDVSDKEVSGFDSS